MAAEPLRATAPAKINLALHVTGRRADGYHLLDSVVVFAGVGDGLSAAAAPALALSVAGPEAGGLPVAADNLVLRAARLLDAGRGRGATLRLCKRLPVASGIGGGSSDAAAALRLLAGLWAVALPDPGALATLGADVPVCLGARPARMRGIGEVLDPLPPLPAFWLVLVNPRVALATAAVFAALERADNPPLPAPPAAGWRDAAALADWLGATRNDLAAPARRLAPAIGTALAALAAQPGCLLARMSGSGATCLGLFAAEEPARAAEAALRRARPAWWIAVAPRLS